MKFEDCYPAEIIEWAQALPEPEQCTPHELAIARLLDCESVTALGRGLLKRLNEVASCEETGRMITDFRAMIQNAAQYA